MKDRIFIDAPIALTNGQVFDGKGQIYTGAKKLTHLTQKEGAVYCDLNKEGITPLPLVSRGYRRTTDKAHSELFSLDQPFNLSVYPKQGSLFISACEKELPDDGTCPTGTGDPDYGFYIDKEKVEHISPNQEIWASGYWVYDWAITHEKVEKFVPETGYFFIKDLGRTQTKPKAFGCNPGQRIWLENTKEGVCDKGDYCIDTVNNQIKFIPKNQTDDVYLSIAERAFALDGLENVVIENCVLTAFVINAITVNNCKNVTIRNCKIYNVGCIGIVVKNSFNVTIENCEIYHTGNHGIYCSCGDRLTLTPSNCAIKNCHLYDIGYWVRTCAPPISVYGVGFLIDGNQIHDCPHMAIQYLGNEIKIFNNVIYNVLLETGDAGAIYSGRDMTFRGNEISDNLICLTGGVGFGTMGIYNDDGLSGTKIERNVFYKVQRAVFLGGGIDFVVKDNLFISCNPAIEADARLTLTKDVLASYYLQTNKDHFYNLTNLPYTEHTQSISAIDSPFIDKYPELKKLHERFSSTKDLPKIFPNGEITDNVIFGKDLSFAWGLSGQDFFDNFIYKNNRNIIYYEDIKDSVPPVLYQKFLKALEIEKNKN